MILSTIMLLLVYVLLIQKVFLENIMIKQCANKRKHSAMIASIDTLAASFDAHETEKVPPHTQFLAFSDYSAYLTSR